MIRRHFVELATMTGIAKWIGCSPSTEKEPLTFVLVPGTLHGGWVWKKVRNILRAKGHDVYTPTPTGVGEREHLLSADVDLYTHIKDITNVIHYEELTNVILVGHSFSGLTITGVADQIQDKINHIIFFDALVPREGTMKAWPNPGAPNYEEYEARKARFLDGYKMDMFKEYPLDMLLSKQYPEERARLQKLISYHPYKQWSTELVLENGGYDPLPKTYIRCAGQQYKASSNWMPGPAKDNPQWNWIELDIPRNGMMTHPELVAKAFIKTAIKS